MLATINAVESEQMTALLNKYIHELNENHANYFEANLVQLGALCLCHVSTCCEIYHTQYTGLFEMIVGGLTTCHTQYT